MAKQQVTLTQEQLTELLAKAASDGAAQALASIAAQKAFVPPVAQYFQAPTIAKPKVDIPSILAKLASAKQRCTYGAMAGVIGGLARSVGSRLGDKNPNASWVVSATTQVPSCYTAAQVDPAFVDGSAYVKPTITTGAALVAFLNQPVEAPKAPETTK